MWKTVLLAMLAAVTAVPPGGGRSRHRESHEHRENILETVLRRLDDIERHLSNINVNVYGAQVTHDQHGSHEHDSSEQDTDQQQESDPTYIPEGDYDYDDSRYNSHERHSHGHRNSHEHRHSHEHRRHSHEHRRSHERHLHERHTHERESSDESRDTHEDGSREDSRDGINIDLRVTCEGGNPIPEQVYHTLGLLPNYEVLMQYANYTHAVCHMHSWERNIEGPIYMRQRLSGYSTPVDMDFDLSGFEPDYHGSTYRLKVHLYGNLAQQCGLIGNPFQPPHHAWWKHGAPNSDDFSGQQQQQQHQADDRPSTATVQGISFNLREGDLGSVECDPSDGSLVQQRVYDDVSLSGMHTILGKSLGLHDPETDEVVACCVVANDDGRHFGASSIRWVYQDFLQPATP